MLWRHFYARAGFVRAVPISEVVAKWNPDTDPVPRAEVNFRYLFPAFVHVNIGVGAITQAGLALDPTLEDKIKEGDMCKHMLIAHYNQSIGWAATMRRLANFTLTPAHQLDRECTKLGSQWMKKFRVYMEDWGPEHKRDMINRHDLHWHEGYWTEMESLITGTVRNFISWCQTENVIPLAF